LPAEEQEALTGMPLTSLPPRVLAAGVVVVRDDGSRYRLLCLRAFDTWDFPVGEVHGDQSPLHAAVEHTRESTGLSDLAFHWGEEYRETVPYEDGRVSRYYLAETATEAIELQYPAGRDSAEDYGYRWVTVDEAEDVLPPRLALVLDWVVRSLASPVPNK
jgi:8-oxo-dGTP pyrophosphatase MutT (NUDIX family)